jgi:hypothetical protein
MMAYGNRNNKVNWCDRTYAKGELTKVTTFFGHKPDLGHVKYSPPKQAVKVDRLAGVKGMFSRIKGFFGKRGQ